MTKEQEKKKKKRGAEARFAFTIWILIGKNQRARYQAFCQ
jgi:hypothetical protein